MFYVSFTRQKPNNGEPWPAAAGQRYVVVSEQYAARSCYFQAYEDVHSLIEMHI